MTVIRQIHAKCLFWIGFFTLRKSHVRIRKTGWMKWNEMKLYEKHEVWKLPELALHCIAFTFKTDAVKCTAIITHESHKLSNLCIVLQTAGCTVAAIILLESAANGSLIVTTLRHINNSEFMIEINSKLIPFKLKALACAFHMFFFHTNKIIYKTHINDVWMVSTNTQLSFSSATKS